MEIWRLILSYIEFDDRPHAWFTLRSLCHTSKEAIEDVCSRYYLPRMKLIAMTAEEAAVYCFTGISYDGTLARFSNHEWEAGYLIPVYYDQYVGLRVQSRVPRSDPWKEYEVFGTYPGAFTTCLHSNPYSLSTRAHEAMVCSGVPWKCLLSNLLRHKMSQRTFGRGRGLHTPWQRFKTVVSLSELVHFEFGDPEFGGLTDTDNMYPAAETDWPESIQGSLLCTAREDYCFGNHSFPIKLADYFAYARRNTSS